MDDMRRNLRWIRPERKLRSRAAFAKATASQGGSRLQLQLEMVRADVHAAVEIETMGGETLDPRIQREVIAAVFLRVLDEPVEERGAEAARAIRFMGDEIVDVESATGEKKIENAKAGHGANSAIEFEIGELVSFLLLLQDAGGEINRL